MLPDLLEQARSAAAARTNGHVVVLSYGEYDFRLDGPPDQEIVFAPAPEFDCARHRERLYLRMGESWYQQAARQWNDLIFSQAAMEAPATADEFLCVQLLRQSYEPGSVTEYAKILRRCMDLPRLLLINNKQVVERECAAIGGLVRSANARALAGNASRYALRACAAALFFSLHYDFNL